VVPGGVELRPRRSLELRGSPELQNGCLRALEEAWGDFLLEAFSCQVCSFSVLLGRLKLSLEGVELRPWKSLEVRGSPELQNGGLIALEDAWDDFLLEAFSCQVCSFSVLLGRPELVPGHLAFPGHLALLERVFEVLADDTRSLRQNCGVFRISGPAFARGQRSQNVRSNWGGPEGVPRRSQESRRVHRQSQECPEVPQSSRTVA
jgi:hypothetical protein